MFTAMLATSPPSNCGAFGHTAHYNGHMSQLAALAEDVGVAERTLRRAAGQGTLRAERLSPRKLRLVPGEAAYVRRNWQLLAALRQALRTEPKVVFAMVFGSAARGDDRPDSDVDLMVVLREQSLEKMVELQDRLQVATGKDIDLVGKEDASRNEVLMAMAVEEGRALVDRVGLWPELQGEREELGRRGDRSLRRDRRRALTAIDAFLS
jgi:predicted nucleotidyltransferase